MMDANELATVVYGQTGRSREEEVAGATATGDGSAEAIPASPTNGEDDVTPASSGATGAENAQANCNEGEIQQPTEEAEHGQPDVAVTKAVPNLESVRQYPYYEGMKYVNGFAVLPLNFPPVRLDKQGNPTQTTVPQSELSDDYFRENIPFLGPLLDRRQRVYDRQRRAFVCAIPPFNTATESNIERFKDDHQKFLIGLKDKMPVYFDGVVANAATAGGESVGLLQSKPSTSGQVLLILKRLGKLAKQGRYPELLARLFNYLYRFTRETGQIRWATNGFYDFALTSGYPCTLAEVDPSTRKRHHRLARLAKSWGSRSILASLRQGMLRWFGCRFYLQGNGGEEDRQGKKGGKWRAWDIADLISREDIDALQSRSKRTVFHTWHPRAATVRDTLQSKMEALHREAFEANVTQEEWRERVNRTFTSGIYSDNNVLQIPQVVGEVPVLSIPQGVGGAPEGNGGAPADAGARASGINPSHGSGAPSGGDDQPVVKGVGNAPGSARTSTSSNPPSKGDDAPPPPSEGDDALAEEGAGTSSSSPKNAPVDSREERGASNTGRVEDPTAAGADEEEDRSDGEVIDGQGGDDGTGSAENEEKGDEGKGSGVDDDGVGTEGVDVNEGAGMGNSNGDENDRLETEPVDVNEGAGKRTAADVSGDGGNVDEGGGEEGDCVDKIEKADAEERKRKKEELKERMKKKMNQAEAKDKSGDTGEADTRKRCADKIESLYCKPTGVRIVWGRGVRKSFGAWACVNCWAKDVDCQHCMCRFCKENVEKELMRREGEKEKEHEARLKVYEERYVGTEKDNGGKKVKRKCDHRWSVLKWCDDRKEVGLRRINYPLVGRSCIRCGDDL